MRSWAVWYRNLFLAWVVIALPGVVIGYGMSGGDFELPSGDIVSVAMWVSALLFLLSPLLLWRWRDEGRKAGF
jgi:hypothetical protein